MNFTFQVHLTSKPPAGTMPTVDPGPAYALCGYEGADEFPAGLPFPVLSRSLIPALTQCGVWGVKTWIMTGSGA